MDETLPALPLEDWKPTRDTLHLYSQIVGKVRLALTPVTNHWWNVTLHVDERGLTTRRMVSGAVAFSISFDFVQHRLVVRTDRPAEESFPLHDGLSVARFYEQLMTLLHAQGIEVEIKPRPYGVPMTTPFPEDTEHASYDSAMVERYFTTVSWVDMVFGEFRGWFCGKASPVHLFWHSFDLAFSRFSGRPAPGPSPDDPVAREAYSREVMGFGWWPGDDQLPMSAFYSYMHPEPADLARQPLRPAEAEWVLTGPTHQARLPLDVVRTAEKPRKTLLEFLQSAYTAGVTTADWPADELRTSWCPVDGG
jgi:uncharacterized protein DUF5996